MMKKLSILLLLLGFAALLRAQDKSDWYYAEHTDEIFGDAQKLYRKGDYSRALDLCNLHRDLLGDENPDAEKVDALVANVLKCQKLATDLENYLEDGYQQAAKAVAEELRAINPYDERLRQFGFVIPAEPREKPEPMLKDNKPVPPQQTDVRIDDDDAYNKSSRDFDFADEIEPKFVIKATGGVVGLGMEAYAPAIQFGGGIGVLDIGESIIGAEAKFNYSGALAGGNASLFGVDAVMDVRLGRIVYPYVGLGWFVCTDKLSKVPYKTNGLCVPFGISFLFGGHFVLELGASFYPAVSVWTDAEAKTTAGAKYTYQSRVDALSAGVAPRISLGVAF